MKRFQKIFIPSTLLLAGVYYYFQTKNYVPFKLVEHSKQVVEKELPTLDSKTREKAIDIFKTLLATPKGTIQIQKINFVLSNIKKEVANARRSNTFNDKFLAERLDSYKFQLKSYLADLGTANVDRNTLNTFDETKDELEKIIQILGESYLAYQSKNFDKMNEMLGILVKNIPENEHKNINTRIIAKPIILPSGPEKNFVHSVNIISNAYAVDSYQCISSYVETAQNSNEKDSQYLELLRPEIKPNSDMIELSRKLGTVSNIFNYVRNEIKYDLYAGASQSAELVYIGKTGNDYDKSSLLISLLRSSGIPSRYVFGEIVVSEDKLQKFWSLEKPYVVFSVSSVLYPNLQGDRYQYIGNKIYYKIPYVWVEAYVEDQNTRTGVNEKKWMALDPSFEQHEYVAKADVIEGLLKTSNDLAIPLFDREKFLFGRDELSGKYIKDLTADMYLSRNVNSLLYYGQNNKQSWSVPLSSLVSGIPQIKSDDNILPYGPLGDQACIYEKVSYIPNNHKVKFRIKIGDIDETFNTVDIGLQDIFMDFIGATPSDNQKLESISIGTLNAANTSIALKARLNIGGNVIKISNNTFIFGKDQEMTIERINSEKLGKSWSYDKSFKAGSINAFITNFRQYNNNTFSYKLNELKNTASSLKITSSYNEKSKFVGKLLYTALFKMLLKDELNDKNTANHLNSILIPGNHLVYMSAEFSPIKLLDRNFGYSLDRPIVSWNGGNLILSRDYNEKVHNIARDITSVSGSNEEHKIMEEFLSIDGRSTVYILQHASEANIPIIKTAYNPGNIDYVLSQLRGYSSWSLETYRKEMVETKEGMFYAPRDVVSISPSHFEVALIAGNNGGYGAYISGYDGGYGGDAEIETSTGITDSNIKNSIALSPESSNYFNNNIELNSKQYNELKKGPIFAGCPASVGMPVNLSNGGMWHKFLDFNNISEIGPSLKFERTYLSKSSNIPGVLGYGWTHNFNIKLETYNGSPLDFISNQDLFFYDENGDAILISLEKGKLLALPYRNFSFKKLNGHYQIKDKNNRILTFFGSGSLIGKLKSISDRNGNELLFEYGQINKLLEKVINSQGKYLYFEYNQNGKMSKVSDFTGRFIEFKYDSAGDLVKSTNLNKNATSYVYYNGLTPFELNHNLKSFKDENGLGVEYFYYDNDKVFKHIEAENKITTFLYQPFNQETLVLDGEKNQMKYRYDVFGNIIRIVNPNGTSLENKYDIYKNIVESKDEDGYITKYTSDQYGNITEIKPSANYGSTFISYDSTFNIPNQFIDPNGNKTLLEIDQTNGNLLSIKQYPIRGSAKEVRTQYRYNALGEIISITDPKNNSLIINRVLNSDKSQDINFINAEGGSFSQKLNPVGKLIESIDLNGKKTTYDYDDLGNLIFSNSSDGNITQRIEYDKSNNVVRVEKVVGGDESVSTYKYDGLGNIIESTNDRGETYKLSYINAGCGCSTSAQLKQMIDPKGGVTRFEYDWRGNITYKVDPQGIRTKMNYDSRGNLAGVTVLNRDESVNSKINFTYGPLNLLSEKVEVVGFANILNRNIFKNSDPAKDVIVKTIYNYDLSGNLSKKTITRPATGEIAKTDYSYNGINKIIGIASTGYKHNLSKAFSYDDNTNLIEIAQNNTKVGFQYDKVNRPIVAQTFIDSSGVVKQPYSALKYSYTPGGQIKSIKDDNGVELVGYEYDPRFNPNLVRSGKYSIGLELDALGRKRKITYPNKLETTFAFDGVNRIDEIDTPDVGFKNYQYDELSNISQIKSEAGQLDYAYDKNSALIGAYYKGGEGLKDEKFVWDASGNRLNGSRDPEESPIRPRPLLINNGLFEDAEPMGNMTGKFSFIYDMHGNVIKKFDNEANIYYVFEYDADNKLVYAEKVNNDSLELKAKYTYDGLGRRIEKEFTKGSTVTRKSYVYNGDNILLEFNTSGATPLETAKYIGSGAIDDNLMTIRNGKGYFYHKDHLGSVTSITNDAGEVVQKNAYSAFGKIISIKDKERRELGVAKALDQPFYYTGREWDDELGLYYYRARSYDPNSGRFIQKDPIGLAGGDTNLYRYVSNQPLSYTDPEGLCELPADVGSNPVDVNNPLAQRYGFGETELTETYPEMAALAAVKTIQAVAAAAPVLGSIKIQGPGGGGRLVGSTIEIGGQRRPFIRIDNGPIDKTGQPTLHYHTPFDPKFHRPIDPFVLPSTDDQNNM